MLYLQGEHIEKHNCSYIQNMHHREYDFKATFNWYIIKHLSQ